MYGKMEMDNLQQNKTLDAILKHLKMAKININSSILQVLLLILLFILFFILMEDSDGIKTCNIYHRKVHLINKNRRISHL